MTTVDKERMGYELMGYYKDVKAWYWVEEETNRKTHYDKLLQAIDLILDSFKENLELDEW